MELVVRSWSSVKGISTPANLSNCTTETTKADRVFINACRFFQTSALGSSLSFWRASIQTGGVLIGIILNNRRVNRAAGGGGRDFGGHGVIPVAGPNIKTEHVRVETLPATPLTTKLPPLGIVPKSIPLLTFCSALAIQILTPPSVSSAIME